ncbi:MAG: copper homeostasis protein CutC [Bacteroidota bacterium]
MGVLIEIAVDTLKDAVAAEQGGAHRIELCSDLAADGLSPSSELVREVRKALTIPIHAMVRPRAGDFCYSDEEFEMMKNEIDEFKSLGVNGIVLGILHADNSVDQERSAELIRCVQPLGVTFHRAFDVAVDPFGSLEKIIAAGAVRLLTSGQQRTAPEGKELITQLIEASRGRITIMPGAGINERTIGTIARLQGIQELHIGNGVKAKGTAGGSCVDPVLVKRLLQYL